MELPGARVEQQQVAFADRGAHVVDAADHRHPHRARDDDDMGGQRPFLEHDALQAAAVIFEQFGGAEVARDQDRILPKAHLRRGAHLPRHDTDQPVRQILQIVHAVAQQRIVDLAHPHPGALLDALDRRLGGQPAVDRLVDAPRPALVIGEHLVGLDDLLMLAADAEIGRTRHAVDLLAHLVEGRVHPMALGLGIVGDRMLDRDARLVEYRHTGAHAVDQLLPVQPLRRLVGGGGVGAGGGVDQVGIGDQLGQHHRDGLQRLDLDLFVTARIAVLDAQDADRALAADDRHPGEAVEQFLARFGAIGKVGVRGGFVEVQRLDLLGDRADQPFAEAEPGDVDRLLLQPARCIEFERAVAQQIDRADFAVEAFANDADDLIELALRVDARRHHLVQPGQYGARGLGGRRRRGRGVGHRNPANRRMRRAPIARVRLSVLFLCGAKFRHWLSAGVAGAAANPPGVVPVVMAGPMGIAGAGVVITAGGGAYFASQAITSA
ncbi:protein of unknown function [uncultured Sphingopyxis sp.]|uniref:Uncharacterized protein n=1 Tax=uncultured Sphingopyxis sp. TaxID=310581 RepID=A0A1Y5PNX2_9SPHN|nr:protein of unknown function [uncultured Sphingopyxis sp.]